jgi:hypothetical protein
MDRVRLSEPFGPAARPYEVILQFRINPGMAVDVSFSATPLSQLMMLAQALTGARRRRRSRRTGDGGPRGPGICLRKALIAELGKNLRADADPAA